MEKLIKHYKEKATYWESLAKTEGLDKKETDIYWSNYILTLKFTSDLEGFNKKLIKVERFRQKWMNKNKINKIGIILGMTLMGFGVYYDWFCTLLIFGSISSMAMFFYKK